MIPVTSTPGHRRARAFWLRAHFGQVPVRDMDTPKRRVRLSFCLLVTKKTSARAAKQTSVTCRVPLAMAMRAEVEVTTSSVVALSIQWGIKIPTEAKFVQRSTISTTHGKLTFWGMPHVLAAPGRMPALRRTMWPVCARRQTSAAGLIGDWRSIASLLSQVTGAGDAAVVVYCRSATNGIDVTGLADGQVYLRTYV